MYVWEGEIIEVYKYFDFILHVLGVCEVNVPWAGKPSFSQTNSHVTRNPVFLLHLVSFLSQEAALSSRGPGSRPLNSAAVFRFLVALARITFRSNTWWPVPVANIAGNDLLSCFWSWRFALTPTSSMRSHLPQSQTLVNTSVLILNSPTLQHKFLTFSVKASL